MVAFSLVLALLTSLAIHKGSAFFSPCEYRRITPTSASLTTLQMAPKYDPLTNEWEPTKPDEEASSGYPPIGSLIRQGPVPFFQRMMNPSNYEQGVLKMMASESMSRNEAQGNMDAYLQNVSSQCVLWKAQSAIFSFALLTSTVRFDSIFFEPAERLGCAEIGREKGCCEVWLCHCQYGSGSANPDGSLGEFAGNNPGANSIYIYHWMRRLFLSRISFLIRLD